MQVVLTLINIRELPNDTPTDVLGYFDAVSLRADAWTAAFGKRLDVLGVERQAWQWINWLKLPGGAAELGKNHGKFCARYGIKVFYANAELDYAAAQNPYVGMLSYINAFRAFAPTSTKLAYNGFSWSKSSEGKLLHDAKLIQKFDIWCPMNYGTDRRTIEHNWDKKNYKYITTGTEIYPMVGVGRVDTDGNVWGFWSDGADGLGLRSLIRKSPINGICFFFGNGAREQMLSGNSKHPPLIQVAEELQMMKG